MDSVITAVINFVFLLAFPTLLSPVAYSDSASILNSDVLTAKSQLIVCTEQHTNTYTTIAEGEAQEVETEGQSASSAAHFAASFLPVDRDYTYISRAISEISSPVTQILSYLSLFSISPPQAS